MTAASALAVRQVTKSYDGRRLALKGVSFEVHRGEFVSLLGPSGCGKTTLLRCIAGLERVSSGTIEIAGRRASARDYTLPPHERKVGMVFQSYALWPHMTVARNVEYPLRFIERDRAVRRRKVDRLLSMLELGEFAGSYPFELSGGQQQRVALARALIGDPAIVLFDEPLSNLDAALRDAVKLMIRALAHEMSFTSLYVTHDRSEALAMSDRVVLLNHGDVVQVADPVTMFQQPATRFAGQFLGDANFFRGEVVEALAGGRARVRTTTRLDLIGSTGNGPAPPTGAEVDVMIRVGNASPARGTGPAAGENRIPVRVRDAIFGGELWQFVGTLDLADAGAGPAPEFTFIATTPVARIGERLELAVPYERALILGGAA
jgi:ABC-type Fe3+/spermidine/putrescine transport system ATPase subunit